MINLKIIREKFNISVVEINTNFKLYFLKAIYVTQDFS